MADTLLDGFDDVSPWSPVTSGFSQLAISREPDANGHAMRLDFDFCGGGGFVVARRVLSAAVPPTCAFSFDIRGSGPRNTLEFKLIDPGGQNVWWHRKKDFELGADWRRLRIRSSEIDFAWGPAGGGAMHLLGAIEIAIVAGPGGQGSVWLRDLRVEDLGLRAEPVVSASSMIAGHGPEGLLDGPRSPGWRSEPDAPQWLAIDFQGEREYGGLVVHWAQGGRARAFAVQTSDDGLAWTTVHEATQADAERSYIYMPKTCARRLRLDLQRSAEGRGFGIVGIDVRPYDSSRSIHAFFHDIAKNDPHRGNWPRYLHGEQSYWTPVGVPDAESCALINEEGMVEVDRGSFSIEPFLHVDGRLVSWAEGEPTTELERGWLPIPSSVWRADGLALRTTAYAAREDGRPVLFIRYRLENTSPMQRSVRLFAACRPFQVNPPWQAFGDLGGVRRISEIEQGDDAVWIDRAKAVVPLADADAFGAAAFEQQALLEHLRKGEVPPRTRVTDGFGCASAALRFDLELPPSATRDVHLAIPFGTLDATSLRALPGLDGADAFSRAVRQWEDKLAGFDLRLAQRWQGYADTLRTAVAHILLNRDGPALQPGPRRYTRCWVRDGAIMAAALLRAGCAEEARDFIRWYARYQEDDGFVPCVVDRTGPDPLVEHDSHGEFIFTVAEVFRFTGDRGFLEEMWPAVCKAVACIERLRATRLDPQFDAAALRARRGLLPESASHEGYLSHPVHAYWDDFWAVRALGDAAYLADSLGEQAQAQGLVTLRDAFRDSLRESIALTIAERGIDFVPGSVEWADFDPSATANALSPLGEVDTMPRAALDRTFARYLERLRHRRSSSDWKDYTAYEVRIVGALVRMGNREAANELADFLLGDRRPLAWNQWPEISWRDPRSPAHIGDVPHAWIGAEYVLAFRTMLAYEREADDALVIAAGIPGEWLDDGGEVEVRKLITWYGTLDCTLRRLGHDALSFSLRGGLAPPAGGIVLLPPLPRPLLRVEIDGQPSQDFDARSVTLRTCPAEVVLRY